MSSLALFDEIRAKNAELAFLKAAIRLFEASVPKKKMLKKNADYKHLVLQRDNLIWSIGQGRAALLKTVKVFATRSEGTCKDVKVEMAKAIALTLVEYHLGMNLDTFLDAAAGVLMATDKTMQEGDYDRYYAHTLPPPDKPIAMRTVRANKGSSPNPVWTRGNKLCVMLENDPDV